MEVVVGVSLGRVAAVATAAAALNARTPAEGVAADAALISTSPSPSVHA